MRGRVDESKEGQETVFKPETPGESQPADMVNRPRKDPLETETPSVSTETLDETFPTEKALGIQI